LRCIGQSVGSETELRNQLKPLTTLETAVIGMVGFSR